MKKIIYFIRHSEVNKNVDNSFNKDSLQYCNEKSILSINGEKIAQEVASLDVFKNVDLVVSSNYARAIGTAKYFADKSGCKLIVSDLFGERKHGINSWDELPRDFEVSQFNDFNFKIGNGESLNEVKKRMLEGLELILNSDFSQVVVISHATCMASLFSNWCDVTYGGTYKFNGKDFFDGNWKYLETFRLEFEDDNLISISNLDIERR